MKAREIIDAGIPFRALRWGVHPRFQGIAYHPFRHMGLPGMGGTLDGFEVIENYTNLTNVCDAQTLSSCTFDSMCQDGEWNIQRTFGQKVQLDVDRLYRAYNEKVNGDPNVDEGAPDGMAAYQTARELGVFPASTQFVYLHDLPGLFAALKRGPVSIGLCVHDGYAPKNLQSENAQVDVSMDAGLRYGENGHQLCLLGTNLHNGVKLLVPRESWGPCGIQNSGLFSIPLDHYVKWALGNPNAMLLNDDDWKKWRGWEAYVLK